MPDIANSRQLYSVAPRGYQLPNFVDHDGKLHFQQAENLPLVTWPDGTWCGPANTYMRGMLEQGLSRRNRGGSLAVAAAHVSHLVRYCWARRVDPINLTDNDFREFIHALQSEVHARDPSRKRRGANSVIAIGRSCLAFLESVARQAGDWGLIGPEGRVQACLREQTVSVGRTGSRSRLVRCWNHPSFPNPDPYRQRMPIRTASIESMRRAVHVISTTSHQRSRRHTILKLLEVTGARRGEIALLTLESVLQADLMEQPMLNIPTLKKRRGSTQHRYVPISRADLDFIKQYALVHRRSVVRRKLKGRRDHGLLLVSDVSGEAICPGTVTQEIRLLAKAAGLQEKACPHMFRHRFLTKLFVTLIEQLEIANVDQFRRLLIDGEELKQKVAEWSGHTNLKSLDRYICLAFDEINDYRKAYDLTSAGLMLDSFMGTIDAEIDAAKSGDQPLKILGRMQTQLEKLKLDLAGTKRSA